MSRGSPGQPAGLWWDENSLHRNEKSPPQRHSTAAADVRTRQGPAYHHVGVVDDRVNVIRGLNQGQAPVPQRDDAGVHADACKDEVSVSHKAAGGAEPPDATRALDSERYTRNTGSSGQKPGVSLSVTEMQVQCAGTFSPKEVMPETETTPCITRSREGTTQDSFRHGTQAVRPAAHLRLPLGKCSQQQTCKIFDTRKMRLLLPRFRQKVNMTKKKQKQKGGGPRQEGLPPPTQHVPKLAAPEQSAASVPTAFSEETLK